MSQKIQKPQKAKKPSGIRYSAEFRQTALERMKSGENVSALARELDIKRTRLYKWKSEQQAKVHSVDQAASACSVESDSIYENKLATLRLQIADLERLIGRQTIDILFFKTALRRLEEIRQKNSHNGVISSIRKSER